MNESVSAEIIFFFGQWGEKDKIKGDQYNQSINECWFNNISTINYMYMYMYNMLSGCCKIFLKNDTGQ